MKISDVLNVSQRVVDKSKDARYDVATVMAINYNRINIRLSGSMRMIYGVEVIGNVNTVNVGDKVSVLWLKSGRLVAFSPNSEYLVTDESGKTTWEKLNETMAIVDLNSATKTTVMGYLTNPGGSLGGWNLNEGRLFSGDGSDHVELSTSDTTYRIWAGADEAVSAPFSVTKGGLLKSTSGLIGGWTISPNGLYSGIGANRVELNTNDANYRIWAGSETAASAPFSVKRDGTLKASSGTIGGWTMTATTLSGTGISLDSAGAIGSTNYASDTSGWRIDGDGNAEFNNAKVRGAIISTVFVRNLTSAYAGSLVIAKSAGKLDADYVVGGTLIIEDPPGGGWLFDTGDYVYIQKDAGASIVYVYITVTRSATENQYTTSFSYGYSGYTYKKGSTAIDYGIAGDGYCRIIAQGAGSPYYGVVTYPTYPWTGLVNKVRLGNLSGITDSVFGGTLSGYGLYSDNVYLKGDLVAASGKVKIQSNGIEIAADSETVSYQNITWKNGSTTFAETGAGFSTNFQHWTNALTVPVGQAGRLTSKINYSTTRWTNIEMYNNGATNEYIKFYVGAIEDSPVMNIEDDKITIIKDILPSGNVKIGSSGAYFTDIYVTNLHASTVEGSTMSGATWSYSGNMTINANGAAETTVAIANTNASYVANLNVEGSIIVGGNVDGVDVSAHAASSSAHHAPITIGTGGLSAKLGLSTQQLTLAAINHSDLSNVTSDQHHARAHVLSGSDHTASGLTEGWVLRASGAAAFAWAAIQDADLPSTIVRTSRTLTAGDGLDGGGDLSANRSFAVDVTDFIDTSYGLTEDTNNIRVNLGSGLTFSTGAIVPNWGTPTISTIEPDDAANAGTSTNPARSDHVHAIAAATASIQAIGDSAIEGTATSFARSDHKHAMPSFAVPTIVLGTADAAGSAATLIRSDATIQAFDVTVPGSITPNATAATGSIAYAARRDHVHGITTAAPTTNLTANSSNTEGSATSFSRSNHVHAITSTSDGHAEKGHLLKSDGSTGNLTTTIFTANTKIITPKIETASGDLSLSPVGIVKTTSDVDIQSDNFTSQTTGWRITYSGDGDFRYLYADEMHVKAFITDIEQALAGGQIICKSVSIVAANFTLPAAGSSGTLWVEDLPGVPDMAVFQTSDIVRLRQFSRAGGSLTVADAWGVVTSYADGTGANDGLQSWTFTRCSVPNAGNASGTIYKKTLALDYGVTKGGYYEVNAIDGSWGSNSPYAQTVSWSTHPKNLTVRTRMGNLNGIFSVADEYGLFVGEGITDASKYLRMSDQAIEAHNLPIKLYDGATSAINLIPGSSPYITIGNPAPTGFVSNDTGIWIGKDTDYKMRVGTVSGGMLSKGLAWDGTNLTVKGNVTIGGSGYLNYGVNVGDAVAAFRFDGYVSPTDYTGNWNSHKGHTPSTDSNVIFSRGKFGKAVQVAESTVNLFTDPSFEYNDVMSQWFFSGTFTTKTRSQAVTPLYGSYVGEFLATTAGYIYRNTSVTATPYTLTAYVRKSDGSAVTTSHVYCLFDNTNAAPDFITHVGNGWYKIEYTGTPTAGTRQFGIRIVSGTTFYMDGMQLENKAYATPYCDGSMGTGHTWNGTVDASISTRVNGNKLCYTSVGLPESGSVSVWVNPAVAPSKGSTYRWIIDQGSESGILLYIWTTNILVFYVGGTYRSIALNDTNFAPHPWHHIVGTWDRSGNTHKLYLNGTLAGSTTYHAPTPGANGLYVGAQSTPTYYFDGWIDDLVLLDYSISAEDVSAIYNSNAPVVVQSSNADLFLRSETYTEGYIKASSTGIYGFSTATGAANTGVFALSTSTVSLGSEFGSVTLSPGDVLIGSAGAGCGNLFYDASAVSGTDASFQMRVGTTPFIRLNADGSGYLANSSISWNTSGVLTVANNAYIGGWVISTYKISSDSGTVGMNSQDDTYDIRFWAGSATLQNSPFYVTKDGYLLASDANITGSITATSGLIGGVTIASNKVYYGTGTFGNSNTSFYFDNAGQFSLKDKLTWNGTTLAINGAITSISGTIGGVNIGDGKLYVGMGTYASSDTGFYLGSDGKFSLKDQLIWSGSALSVAGTVVMKAGSTGFSFEEYFDGTVTDFGNRWDSFSGSGEVSYTTGGVAGNNVLQVGDNSGNDQRWYVYKYSIPYDTHKLYRMFVRVRRTAGSGTVYLGVCGRDATDSAWVNYAGTNTLSSQHYVVAAGLAPGSSFSTPTTTEYTGYFKGTSGTGSTGACPSPASPGVLHTNVRYFRPMFLVNYNGVAGTVGIDEVRVDVVPNTFDSPWRNSTDTTTIDGSNIYTGTVTADKITATTLSAIQANTGALTISDTLTVDAAGKIVCNTTSTGITMGYITDGYYLRGTSSGVTQFEAKASDGKLYAGAGSVMLDSSGLTVYGASKILFKASTSNTYPIGYITADATNYLDIGMTYSASATSYIRFGSSSQIIMCPDGYTVLTATGILSETLRSVAVTGSMNASKNVRAGLGIYAGSTSDDPGSGNVCFTGSLKKYTSALTAGYIYVPFASPVTNTSWDGDTKTYSASAYSLDLSTWDAALAYARAVHVMFHATWSAASNSYSMTLRPKGGSAAKNVATVRAQTTYAQDMVAIVPCDANGDIDVYINGADAAVSLRIVGYFI